MRETSTTGRSGKVWMAAVVVVALVAAAGVLGLFVIRARRDVPLVQPGVPSVPAAGTNPGAIPPGDAAAVTPPRSGEDRVDRIVPQDEPPPEPAEDTSGETDRADGSDALPPEIERAIARATDATVPLEVREKEIAALGRRGDGEAAAVLMALADRYIYLNRAAVKTLGEMGGPDVAAYLRRRLTEVDTHDVALLCEVIGAAGRALGEDAIPDLAALLKAVRNRNDGHAIEIARSCVRVIGDLKTPKTIDVLKDEIDYLLTRGEKMDLTYGSDIVQALGKTADAAARPVLLSYADALSARVPADPQPRAYFEEKIGEARAVAGTLPE